MSSFANSNNNNNSNSNNNSSIYHKNDDGVNGFVSQSRNNRVYEIDELTEKDYEFIFDQNSFGYETRVFFFYKKFILGNNKYAHLCKSGHVVWKSHSQGIPALVDFTIDNPPFIDGRSPDSVKCLIHYMDYWNNDLFFNGVTTLKLVSLTWGAGWALFTTDEQHSSELVEKTTTGILEFCNSDQWERLSHVGVTLQDEEDKNQKPTIGSLIIGNAAFLKYPRDSSLKNYYLIKHYAGDDGDKSLSIPLFIMPHQSRNKTSVIRMVDFACVRISHCVINNNSNKHMINILPANTIITALFNTFDENPELSNFDEKLLMKKRKIYFVPNSSSKNKNVKIRSIDKEVFDLTSKADECNSINTSPVTLDMDDFTLDGNNRLIPSQSVKNKNLEDLIYKAFNFM